MYSPMYVGIDPGLEGAVAVMDGTGKYIRFTDTPTVTLRSGKKFKKQMDPSACSKVLEGIVAEAESVIVTIEKVQAMPGGGERSMGATSAFSFGFGFGIWIGLLAALKVPYQMVHPMTWKKAMMYGMGKEKDASRLKAMQLFPVSSRDLYLKKHHGRADALLLAAYGRKAFAAMDESADPVEAELF